jgi:hypothetical protein
MAKVWSLADFAGDDRPGLHHEHVFDLRCGIRLIASVDDIGDGPALHVSASIHDRSTAAASASTSADPIAHLLRSMLSFASVVLGVQPGQFRFTGFLGDKKIPNWSAPWPPAGGICREIIHPAGDVHALQARVPKALADGAMPADQIFQSHDGIIIVLVPSSVPGYAVAATGNIEIGSLADENCATPRDRLSAVSARICELLGIAANELKAEPYEEGRAPVWSVTVKAMQRARRAG